MNKKLAIKLLIGFLIMISTSSFAFTNEELSDTLSADTLELNESQQRYYDWFVSPPERETKRLWKINIVDLARLNLTLTLEQRILSCWTSETSLGIYYSLFDYPADWQDNPQSKLIGTARNKKLSAEQQVKYYYNFNRRERMGKSINGFNGNYIAVRFSYDLAYPWDDKFFDQVYYAQDSHTFQAGLRYGIHRKIGKIGYFEVYGGLAFEWETITYENYLDGSDTMEKTFFRPLDIQAGIRAGFAIDSFKRR